MNHSLGYLIPSIILGEYNSSSKWDTNCADTASQNVYRIEYQDCGTEYDPSDMEILSERIVCAMRSIDQDNGIEKDFDNYQSLYEMFILEWDEYQKNNSNIDVEVLFLQYVKIVADAISNTDALYYPVTNAMRRNLEVIRAEWGYPYDASFSYEATKSGAVEKSVAQGISLVAKYNRKARAVSFYRPQFSRKNIRRGTIALAILGVTIFIATRKKK
jgi:hypothetical protein